MSTKYINNMNNISSCYDVTRNGRILPKVMSFAHVPNENLRKK